jgi:hypothetical protein
VENAHTTDNTSFPELQKQILNKKFIHASLPALRQIITDYKYLSDKNRLTHTVSRWWATGIWKKLGSLHFGASTKFLLPLGLS